MQVTLNQTDRNRQLRKVAILVATLGDTLAEQLLADLPQRDAEDVRAIAADLDDIDPAEYEAMATDFRRGIPASTPPQPKPTDAQLSGVELDASLLARIESGESVQTTTTTETSSPWKTISNADTNNLVEMLRAEQPQTIAVVLSKLEPVQAADLLARFSPAMQGELLTRLADLDPADERTLQVVESQLAQWIHAQQQRQQRMAAGFELVQKILQDTPDHQRPALLTQLSKRDPALADRLSRNPRPQQTVQRLGLDPATGSQRPHTEANRASAAPTDHASDPLSELEALDNDALLRALQLADRQTVMLALAGASETLMRRIVQGLPRRQATQFRQQVRAIGPARLSDMIAAQRELIHCSQV